MTDYAGYTAEALRALCAGAPQGPWTTGEADPNGIGYAGACYTDEVFGPDDPYKVLAGCDNPAIAAFIAAARAALPAMLDRVAALEAENARLARRCRAMESALARGVELMPIDLLAQWDGVRAAQEWDGVEDDRVAALEAENARLREALEEAGQALKATADSALDTAGEMGCSAGNFDGGNAWDCEHCQTLQYAAHLDALAGRARAARDAGLLPHEKPRLPPAPRCEQCRRELDTLTSGICEMASTTGLQATVCGDCAELLFRAGWIEQLRTK